MSGPFRSEQLRCVGDSFKAVGGFVMIGESVMNGIALGQNSPSHIPLLEQVSESNSDTDFRYIALLLQLGAMIIGGGLWAVGSCFTRSAHRREHAEDEEQLRVYRR